MHPREAYGKIGKEPASKYTRAKVLKAKALRPLGGKPAPGHDRPSPTYTDGAIEEDAPQANVAARPAKGGRSGRDMRHR